MSEENTEPEFKYRRRTAAPDDPIYQTGWVIGGAPILNTPADETSVQANQHSSTEEEKELPESRGSILIKIRDADSALREYFLQAVKEGKNVVTIPLVDADKILKGTERVRELLLRHIFGEYDDGEEKP